ncbi:MAG: NUDIX domain-containing protein [Clostridia bacterium]|nr:NUDIX domain-containing protein [Clostridia bacterium]
MQCLEGQREVDAGRFLSLLESEAISGPLWMVLGALVDEPLKRLCRTIYRRGRRAALRVLWPSGHNPKREILYLTDSPRYGWVVLDTTSGKGYSRQNLVTRFVDEPPLLPPVVQELRRQVQEELSDPYPGGVKLWNGGRYYLRSFTLTRLPDEEEPRLIFGFGPSDYYNFLATSLSLDRKLEVNGTTTTLREMYLRDADPWAQPISCLAHSFGINLAVITRDNHLLLTRRSRYVSSRPAAWTVAVNEGLQRPADKDEAGNPDFYKAAVRGVYEELGVSLRENTGDWPLFLSFGLDWELYQYALLGRVRLNLSLKEVRDCWELNSRDKWEGEITAIPFTLKHFSEFVKDHGPWSPAGVICIIHALMADEGVTIETVTRELNRVGVRYLAYPGGSQLSGSSEPGQKPVNPP